jgi:hypothetical protein
LYFSGDTLDNLDSIREDKVMVNEALGFDIDDDIINIEGPPGKQNLKRIHDMAVIENSIKNAGWFDVSDNLTTQTYKAIIPECHKVASEWKTCLDQKKSELLNDKVKNMHNNHVNPQSTIHTDIGCNEVHIVDEVYVNSKYKVAVVNTQNSIKEIADEFCLNSEQFRAFHIVTNHVAENESSPKKIKSLNMYLGGMGGTGKSQVIKALIKFFKIRNESHRFFLVLAPTGSAAALLEG